jgi:hypothetical protein
MPVLAGLSGGVVYGAGIGAIVRSERWARYDLPSHAALLLPP